MRTTTTDCSKPVGIVYIYTFPNGKKYIGQTTRALEQRAGKNGYNYKDQLVGKAIEKYGWDSVKIETYDCFSFEEMDTLEQEFIKSYNTMNRDFGYNLDSGGHLNKVLSEEAKQKISFALKGRPSPRLGCHLSKETKDKISKAKLGENNPRFGKPFSEETIEKMRAHAANSKKVICIETKEVYPSAAAAARSIGISKGTKIQEVCNKGQGYTAYGYHWAWLSDYQGD